MKTNITVSENTKESLEILRKQRNFSDYDQVIQSLLRNKTKISISMFGSCKSIKWNKKDRMNI